jgi:hypothetical protein
MVFRRDLKKIKYNMKSLYNVLQESIFDDEDMIMNNTENKIYDNLLNDIINSKSFKEYEDQISELNDLLKDNAKLVSKGDKRVTRFNKDSIYLILLHKTGDFTSEHSNVYIGNASDNTTQVIIAYEQAATPHNNRIVNVKGSKNIKFFYKNLYDAVNSWMTSANLYVYKIDGTKFEGLLKYMNDLGAHTRYIN